MTPFLRRAAWLAAALAFSGAAGATGAPSRITSPTAATAASAASAASCPDVAWNPEHAAQAEAHLARGHEAMLAGQRSVALAEWQAGAALGHPRAQNDLGVALTGGTDRIVGGELRRDMRPGASTEAAAQRCLSLAAAQGDARALVNLGHFHYTRREFPQAFAIYDRVLADCAPDRLCLDPNQAMRVLGDLRKIGQAFIDEGDVYLGRMPAEAADRYAMALAALCGNAGTGSTSVAPCREPALAQRAADQWSVAVQSAGTVAVADNALASRGSTYARQLARLPSNFDALIEANPTAAGPPRTAPRPTLADRATAAATVDEAAPPRVKKASRPRQRKPR